MLLPAPSCPKDQRKLLTHGRSQNHWLLKRHESPCPTLGCSLRVCYKMERVKDSKNVQHLAYLLYLDFELLMNNSKIYAPPKYDLKYSRWVSVTGRQIWELNELNYWGRYRLDHPWGRPGLLRLEFRLWRNREQVDHYGSLSHERGEWTLSAQALLHNSPT